MEKNGDSGAFVAEHSRRAGQRRRERAALGGGHGRAAAIGAVAGETDRIVERAARAVGLESVHAEQADELRILVVGFVPELLVDGVNADGLGRFGGGPDDLLGIGQPGATHRKHGLDGDARIGVPQRAAHGDDERGLGRGFGVDAQLRQAQARDPHLRVGGLQRAQDEFVIERAETVERPQRMQARAGISGVAASKFLEGRHDREIATQDEEFLRGVAPPAIGMGQVLHPLGGSFVEHARLRTGLEILVTQAIDAAPPDLLLQIVGLDLFAQVRAFRVQLACWMMPRYMSTR